MNVRCPQSRLSTLIRQINALATPLSVNLGDVDLKTLRVASKQINERIGKVLEQKETPIDDTTRAHLDECRFRIAKVLDAAVQANEP